MSPRRKNQPSDKSPAKPTSGRARSKPVVDDDAARFAYEGIDRVMHEKARLGILTSLATHPEGLIFSELKELCGLTDGNLSRHLSVLQESELVEIWKGFRGKKPQTLCRITADGRLRFLQYIAVLEDVVQDAMNAKAKPPVRDLPDGWSMA